MLWGSITVCLSVCLSVCLRRELLSRRDTCKAARMFQPRVWCLILLLAMENSVRRWRDSVIFTRLRSALLRRGTA